MRWKPVVVQSETSHGSLVVTVGHPLVDAYLEFLRARARPNTIRAVAFDLKVFFSFVDKTPTRVTSVGCDGVYHRPTQRRWRRQGGGDRPVGGVVAAHDPAAVVVGVGVLRVSDGA